MIILNIFLMIALAIWALVAIRYLSIPVQCFGVIAVGSVLGFELFHYELGPVTVTLDRLVLLLVIIQVLAARARAYDWPTRLTRLDFLVAGWAILLTVSTFAHDWTYKDNLPLGRLLFLNLMPIAAYAVIRLTRVTSGDLTKILWGFGALGVYLTATAFFEVLGPQALVWPAYIVSPEHYEFLGRARGPFLNPVACGIFQITSAAAAMMFWPHLNRVGKAILVALAPFFLVGIFLTLTRSVWLAAGWVAFGICWLPLDIKYKGVLTCIGLLSAATLLVLFVDDIKRFKRDEHVSAYEMAQSSELRPLLANVAWKMIQDRPVWGSGFGQYTKYKKPYHFESNDGQPLQRALPYMQHNVVLSYLTETGIVGTTLFLCVLAGFTKCGWDLWRNRRQTLRARQFGILLLVVLSCYLINGMFHDVSIIPMLGMLVFFFAAIAVNLQWQHVDEGDHQRYQRALVTT